MLMTLMLLLVPAAALGLVLGMDRLEDTLLRRPARHRNGAVREDAAASSAHA